MAILREARFVAVSRALDGRLLVSARVQQPGDEGREENKCDAESRRASTIHEAHLERRETSIRSIARLSTGASATGRGSEVSM